MAAADRSVVQIRVAGELGPVSEALFDDLALADGGDGTTVLEGEVLDQAALHGILDRIRDLGLSLLAVETVEAGASAPSSTHHIGGS